MPMRLPLAIHAARQGYAWLNQSQHDFSLLERFRKAIGKMPDIDCGEHLSCGALNVDDWVVVYRFMIEKGGDFLGRDCIYLALTYFDRSIASSVHIARLLELPFFAAPMRHPPDAFDYEDCESLPCHVNPVMASSAELLHLDFLVAGAAFQHPFSGTLRIIAFRGSPLGSCDVKYLPEKQLFEKVGNRVHDDPLDASALNDEPQKYHRLKYERLLIAIAVVVFVVGGLVKIADFLCSLKRIEEQEFHEMHQTGNPNTYPWMNVHICLRTLVNPDDSLCDGDGCLYCTRGDK
ncbi:MAG: hypothetical protein WCJ02_02655 [bacterium]